MARSGQRHDTGERARRRFDAALKGLGPPWIVLADVCLVTSTDRFVLDHVLVHPACGVVLIDDADRSAGHDNRDAIGCFQRFLDEGEFEIFFSGYLPVVRVSCAHDTSDHLPRVIADAFAHVPLLSIKDAGWANALATVMVSAGRNRPEAFAPAASPAKGASKAAPNSAPMAAPVSAPMTAAAIELPPMPSAAAMRRDDGFHLSADPNARPVSLRQHVAWPWMAGLVLVTGAAIAAAALWHGERLASRQFAAKQPAVSAPIVGVAPRAAARPPSGSSRNASPSKNRSGSAGIGASAVAAAPPLSATAAPPSPPPLAAEKPVLARRSTTPGLQPSQEIAGHLRRKEASRVPHARVHAPTPERARAAFLTPEGSGPPINARDLPPLPDDGAPIGPTPPSR